VDVPNTKKELKALPPATLSDMCNQLGLEVTGAGSRGKVRKSDYVDALYEYARAAAGGARRAGRPPAASASSSRAPARAAAAAGAAKTKTPSANEWAKQRAADQKQEKDAYFDWWLQQMLLEKDRAQGGVGLAAVFRNAQTAQAAQCAMEERYHTTFTAPMLARMKTEEGAPIFGVGEAADGIDLEDLAKELASSALEGDGEGEQQ